eukprot:evm.model.scf_1178EXC.1 EVM.evm.TU.scf_1178EXC.1   scf_1178EXC:13443-17623(+)
MGPYFQYLAFAMEPRPDRHHAVFTPLAPHWSSWSKKTNVAYPVFVNPRCTDRTSSKRKLLLAVIGKEVTLRVLEEEDGLGEKEVDSLIKENFAKTKVCNGDYEYDLCKLQELRGSTSECPARSWRASDREKCYAFKSVHYVLVAEPTDFEEAQQRCKDMGGRLAEPSVEQFKDDLHFLASIIPPDGAWIGLRPGPQWKFLSSSQDVPERLTRDLWFTKPSISGSCRGSYVDPRGTLHNVGSRLCNDETAFVCQLDETTQPELCKGNITPVLSEALWNATAEGCASSGGCIGGIRSTATVGNELPNSRATSSVICDFGPPKPFSELMCCSRDELQGVCE